MGKLVVWLVVWLVGWLVGWLVCWLFGWWVGEADPKPRRALNLYTKGIYLAIHSTLPFRGGISRQVKGGGKPPPSLQHVLTRPTEGRRTLYAPRLPADPLIRSGDVRSATKLSRRYFFAHT